MYQQFITDVFDSGWFEAEIDRVQAMIDPYVQQDPTAFCTYEEFLAGAETLREFCIRRARSVTNQLNGDAARVDASDLNLSLMGTMNGMGGGMGGFDMGGMGGDSREDRNAPAGNESSGNGAQPTDGFAGFDPAQGMPSQMPVNGAAGAMPQMSGDMFAPFGGQASAPATEESAAAAVPEDDAAQPTDDAPRGRPGSGGGFSMNGVTPQSSSNGWLWLGACALLLAAALILARCWRTNR